MRWMRSAALRWNMWLRFPLPPVVTRPRSRTEPFGGSDGSERVPFMRNPTRRRPHPATVISLLALAFSMAGTATAAIVIKSSSQIKNGAVTGSDIKNASVAGKDIKPNALTGATVKNGSLESDDFSGAARGALQAAETQALEAFRKAGPENGEKAKLTRVATLANVPAGTYAIFAKTVLTPFEAQGGCFGQSATISGHCVLDAGGDKDEARALLGTPGALAPGAINTQITRAFGSGGSVVLDCEVLETTWRASDTSIIAIRVGKAPRSPVEG